MKKLLVILLFVPVFSFSQVVKFMGRYDVSQVDHINDSTWTLTGTFTDLTGSYTALNADTNSKIVQRGYDTLGRLVFDRYKVVGVISQTVVDLVVKVRSDYSTGVQNSTGTPFTGSFPIAMPTADTSNLTYRTSFYQNQIDPDYDAALDNLNLNAVNSNYLTSESDPHYIADTNNIAYLDQENTFNRSVTIKNSQGIPMFRALGVAGGNYETSIGYYGADYFISTTQYLNEYAAPYHQFSGDIKAQNSIKVTDTTKTRKLIITDAAASTAPDSLYGPDAGEVKRYAVPASFSIDTSKVVYWPDTANVLLSQDRARHEYIPLTQKHQNNGVATLDAGGKVPFSELPATLMIYKGLWNPNTNAPTLADGTGVSGWVYKCSVGDTINLGSGSIIFFAGDFCIHNGTSWERSVGTDNVVSVNNQQGIVSLNTSHIPSVVDIRYVTDAEKAAITHANRPLLDVMQDSLNKAIMWEDTTKGKVLPATRYWVKSNYFPSIGIESGTANGQMLYWDTDKWKHSAGILWNEANDRLMIGMADNGTNAESIRFNRDDGNRYNSIYNLCPASGVAGSMDFRVHDGSTQATVMTLLGNGSVGIGTTAPLAKFHVKSTLPVFMLEDAAAYNASPTLKISFTGQYDSTPSHLVDFAWITGGKSNTTDGDYCGYLAFHTNTLGPPYTPRERVRIDKDGNVGIGTTAPVVKLQVNGNIAATGVLNAFTTAGSIQIGFDGTKSFITANAGGGANAPLAFYAGSNSPTMLITSTGSVGIGTTTPIAAYLTTPGSTTNSSAVFGALELQSFSSSSVVISDNIYFDGTDWKLRATNAHPSSNISLFRGGLSYGVYAAGSAGDTKTGFTKFSVDASGNGNFYGSLGVSSIVTMAGLTTAASEDSIVGFKRSTGELIAIPYKTIEPKFGTAVDSSLILDGIKFPIGYSQGFVIDTVIFIATGAACSVTPSISFGTNHTSSGTAVVTSPSAVTSVTTATKVSSFNNATIPKGNMIWLTFSTVATVPRNIMVQIIGHNQ